MSAPVTVSALDGHGVVAATLIRSAWNSMALRAAAALGLGGLALAGSNLILARVLSPADFAQFALLYSIVQVGINIAPIGADVAMARRLIEPDAKLHRQTFFSSLIVAAILVVISALLYPLSAGLLATALVSITGGGLQIAAVGYYRGRERIGFSLLISSCANAALLLASLVAMQTKMPGAMLPAVALTAALSLTALIAWRGIRSERQDWKEADAPFPWAVGWAAVSFIGAGIILTSLDRLVIPGLLGMPELATFTILATVAGSPFAMLYQAVSYTLVPRLRNAPNVPQRRRALVRESAVVGMTCLAAAIAILWLMPLILKWVLANRYAIGQPLLIAAIAVGFLKVIASLTAAAVNALGSRAELINMSHVGWISIGVALTGAGVGAHWGLIGLVYGVAAGWLVRAVAVGYIAAPHLLRESDISAGATHAATVRTEPTN